MRRKAHELMWPGMPYVEKNLAPAAQSFQRAGGSLRLEPRGVLQFMTHKRTGSARSLNKVLSPPRISAEGHHPMKLAAKPPVLNVGSTARPLSPRSVKLSGSPVRPQNAAKVLYQPAARVQYEPGKPVKDVICALEKK